MSHVTVNTHTIIFQGSEPHEPTCSGPDGHNVKPIAVSPPGPQPLQQNLGLLTKTREKRFYGYDVDKPCGPLNIPRLVSPRQPTNSPTRITDNLRFFNQDRARNTVVKFLIYTEKMILLPQQNVLLIQPQQTKMVGVTMSLVTVTTVIVVVTIHIVVVPIEIVTTAILVC